MNTGVILGGLDNMEVAGAICRYVNARNQLVLNVVAAYMHVSERQIDVTSATL